MSEKKPSPLQELGQLIDCTEKDFESFCSNKDVGYLSGLLNLMTTTYNQVSKMNDDLVEKGKNLMKQGKATPETLPKEITDTLNGLHSKLLRIEMRVFLLRDYVKSKQLDPVELLPKDN